MFLLRGALRNSLAFSSPRHLLKHYYIPGTELTGQRDSQMNHVSLFKSANGFKAALDSQTINDSMLWVMLYRRLCITCDWSIGQEEINSV